MQDITQDASTSRYLVLETGLSFEVSVTFCLARRIVTLAWIQVDDHGPVPGDDFPALVLIVSGGHTELVLMRGHCGYAHLGGTLDDAAGEAFDKVARLLELGFPGGPAIQRAAELGDATRFPLPRPLTRQKEHRFNFSFSGLKTQVLLAWRDSDQSEQTRADKFSDLHVSGGIGRNNSLETASAKVNDLS